jgi:hypothetical protein
MKKKRSAVVKAAAQMWPRAVFDFDGKVHIEGCLKGPGVYVLFRDDRPYYIGKTQSGLFKRIQAHAIRTGDNYYHFWNYFSAFEVPIAKHRDEIEGVLIASMPTAANGASPKIKKIGLPKTVAQLMRKIRKQGLEFDG